MRLGTWMGEAGSHGAMRREKALLERESKKASREKSKQKIRRTKGEKKKKNTTQAWVYNKEGRRDWGKRKDGRGNTE